MAVATQGTNLPHSSMKVRAQHAALRKGSATIASQSRHVEAHLQILRPLQLRIGQSLGAPHGPHTPVERSTQNAWQPHQRLQRSPISMGTNWGWCAAMLLVLEVDLVASKRL